MTTNELKLSWNGLVWTHSGEVDTGIFDAPSMKTVISLLSALKTGGFTATQVVLDNTSIKSLTLTCDIQVNPYQAECLKNYATSQTSGLTSNQSKTTSSTYQLVSLGNWDGESGQITTSGYLEDASYLTSTQTEVRLDTTRLDTLEREIEDLRSRVDAVQSATDSNVSQSAFDTWLSQREAETPLFSGCAGYPLSPYQAQVLERCYEEWRNTQSNMDLSWYASETETRQETN